MNHSGEQGKCDSRTGIVKTLVPISFGTDVKTTNLWIPQTMDEMTALIFITRIHLEYDRTHPPSVHNPQSLPLFLLHPLEDNASAKLDDHGKDCFD